MLNEGTLIMWGNVLIDEIEYIISADTIKYLLLEDGIFVSDLYLENLLHVLEVGLYE